MTPLNRALEERAIFTAWMFHQALPLWATLGTDWQNGGFRETIDRHGASPEVPRRTRVVGRQIYSYAVAQKIGWAGGAERVVAHGVRYLLDKCIKPDGSVVSQTLADGTVVDGRFDLYDHAFALFSLAAAAATGHRRKTLARAARRMRNAMRAGWGHPVAGFEEAVPRTLPLKANPHMHVFEASLAWIDAGPEQGDDGWDRLADEIAELCLAKFIDPLTVALREFFDGDWNPVSGDEGRIVEPGHQFEWAWLLIRWGLLRNRQDALDAAARLIAVGENAGTDPVRGLAVSEIWDDLTIKDDTARLWQQTERIKAWLAAAAIAGTPAERDIALERVAMATAGLRKYWDFPVAGGAWENIRADGSFRDEAARASSVYHMICALAEMHRLLVTSVAAGEAA